MRRRVTGKMGRKAMYMIIPQLIKGVQASSPVLLTIKDITAASLGGWEGGREGGREGVREGGEGSGGREGEKKGRGGL